MDTKKYSRKDFIKISALTVGASALPFNTGCLSVPDRKLPKINYKKIIQLKNCNIVDVEKGIIKSNQIITIKDNKIISVQKNNYSKLNSNAEIIDIKGKYVIPGLIDAHLHTTLSGGSEAGIFDGMANLKQIKRNFYQNLKSGVTTVRDMGSFSRMLHYFIDDIKSGDLPGPKVVFCNSILNISGGHPDIKPSDISMFAAPMEMVMGNMMTNFSDMKDLDKKLHENIEQASFIKLTMDNKSLIAGRDNIKVYKKEHLNYIFKIAEKKNLPVVGHNMYEYGFKKVLQYPFHSIEHVVTDHKLSEKDIYYMADKKISIVPTVALGNLYSFDHAYKVLPVDYKSEFIYNEINIRKKYFSSLSSTDVEPAVHRSNINALKWYKNANYNYKAMAEDKVFAVKPDPFFKMLINGKSNIKKMHEAGVLIGCGTDAGVPFNYHGKIWRELEILSRFGFTNKDIIKFATINNAKILKMEDQIGSVEKDKIADLVVLNSNPLKDIKSYRNPFIVMKEGKVEFIN